MKISLIQYQLDILLAQLHSLLTKTLEIRCFDVFYNDTHTNLMSLCWTIETLQTSGHLKHVMTYRSRLFLYYRFIQIWIWKQNQLNFIQSIIQLEIKGLDESSHSYRSYHLSLSYHWNQILFIRHSISFQSKQWLDSCDNSQFFFIVISFFSILLLIFIEWFIQQVLLERWDQLVKRSVTHH